MQARTASGSQCNPKSDPPSVDNANQSPPQYKRPEKWGRSSLIEGYWHWCNQAAQKKQAFALHVLQRRLGSTQQDTLRKSKIMLNRATDDDGPPNVLHDSTVGVQCRQQARKHSKPSRQASVFCFAALPRYASRPAGRASMKLP